MLVKNLSAAKRVVAMVTKIFWQGDKVFRLRGMFQVLPVPIHARIRRVFSS